MGISPEIELSKLSALLDQGNLTFKELQEVSEAVLQMISNPSEIACDAAKNIFDKAEKFKAKRVMEDISQLDRLAAIHAHAQKLSVQADEMDPVEQEKEVAELSEEVHSLKEFFTPKIAEEAIRVRNFVEDLEIKCVFPIVTDLEEFSRILERKAVEIEGF